MFDRIIAFSIRNRLLVVALAALVVAYGGWVLRSLPVDVFPDLNRPTVTIFTEAPGLSPEEVENLVTLPLETAVNGATHVERVRSLSGIGLSLVFVEFDWKTDIYLARQIVAERIQGVGENLPEGIRPFLGPISSIMGQIMAVGLTSTNPKVGPIELRSLAEWDIKRRLLAIPGVSQITIQGGDLKEYQVLVDPRKLISYGISLHEVRTALEESNVNSSGGFLVEAYEEKLIRNIARVESPEDLGKTVVKSAPGGVNILLRDIAEIRAAGPLVKRGDAGINGLPAVMLAVAKQPGSDTISLTRAVERELQSLQKTLPEGVTIHDDIFRQANFIERAISNVEEALRDGSIMVSIVLFLFLLNFRTTFITLTAIPLSLLVTFIVFKWFGLGINTMTLGGLAVAIGELVDDAIVDVENVFRRLRENRLSPSPKPVASVVLSACREVRNSIVFATLIVVLVFIPLFALSGIEGRIFAPLGMAYIVSIAASLLVAVTVTPALCSYLLPNMKKMAHPRDGALVRFFKWLVARILAVGFRVPKTLFTLVAAGFLGALALVPLLGREFLPPFNEGSATVFVVSAPGTSLEESTRMGRVAEKLLREVPEVRTIGRRTGRAEGDEHVMEVNSTEIEFELAPSDRPRSEILSSIRARMAEIPGVLTSVGQPISHRIDHLLSGVQAQVAIKIFGDDLETLREKAEAIRAIVAGIPGFADVQAERQTLIPQIHVRINRDKAALFGLRPGEVARYAELALRGSSVTKVLEGQRSHDVTLRLPDSSRTDLESIRQIPIDTLNGQLVPLGLVADVEEAMGPNMVNRENGQRRIYVSANVAGRDLVGAVEEARQKIATEVDLPIGYFISYGGQFESQASASRLLLLLGLASLTGMFLVLYLQFRSINLALQVMLNIPLAFIGSVVGVWFFSDKTVSIASMVGFIALTGIAARNGIMMISHYLHLLREEGESFDQKMILRGTQERIIPVLMTALTAGFALVPLLLGAGQPGREILHPVAVVIFFGLFSSTLLDLTIRPLVFWKFGRRAAEQHLNPNQP
ncbi:MAG: efflux RND transporter permease subunit [Terrimicrobiaceae bacterium]